MVKSPDVTFKSFPIFSRVTRLDSPAASLIAVIRSPFVTREVVDFSSYFREFPLTSISTILP